MTQMEAWILGCTIVMACAAIAACVVSVIALNKKQDVKVEQPVSITVTEELHDMFAAKDVFEKHCEETKRGFDLCAQQRGEDLRAASASRKTIYDKIEEASEKLRDDLDEKHINNEKRINRSNWMLARLCERNRIVVPSEEENL
jgi:hypothetical protein